MKLLPILGLLAIAGAARAGLPSPANSTIPSQIPVVGLYGAQPDTLTGAVEVIVRDIANNVVPNSLVTLDFPTAPEVHLATDMHAAGVSVDCGTHRVSKYTDAAGRARFTIVGYGSGLTAQPGALRAVIYESGHLLGWAPVVIYDLDGFGGMAANDASLWLHDFGALENAGRGDYDNTGSLGANDLSVWLTTFGRLGSAESATSVCP